MRRYVIGFAVALCLAWATTAEACHRRHRRACAPPCRVSVAVATVASPTVVPTPQAATGQVGAYYAATAVGISTCPSGTTCNAR